MGAEAVTSLGLPGSQFTLECVVNDPLWRFYNRFEDPNISILFYCFFEKNMIYLYIMEDMNMLAIRISHDIENRLQHLAQRTGRTKTYYAREAILRFIEDMEDEYLALSRLETPTKRWTLDELEQEVDLES